MNDLECDGSERASWGFVGDCGGRALLENRGEHHFIVDLARFVAWMKIGLAFLKLTYGEPPENCTLGVLWAQGPHSPGKFPVIALGSDDWTEEAKDYFDRLEQGLAAFDNAVDWERMPRITTPTTGSNS